MHLSDYMTKYDLSDDDIAALIGRSRPTVSRIRRGLLRPDWQTIAALKGATKGAVTADDFLDIEAIKVRAS